LLLLLLKNDSCPLSLLLVKSGLMMDFSLHRCHSRNLHAPRDQLQEDQYHSLFDLAHIVGSLFC
jgi:hypothetical protein